MPTWAGAVCPFAVAALFAVAFIAGVAFILSTVSSIWGGTELATFYTRTALTDCVSPLGIGPSPILSAGNSISHKIVQYAFPPLPVSSTPLFSSSYAPIRTLSQLALFKYFIL